MTKYIRAEEGEKNSVIYYNANGNQLIRYWRSYDGEPASQASTRSWRNNNPGNILIGPFARRNGAIGEAGVPTDQTGARKVKFAVFPDYKTGRKAQALRLKEGPMYIDLTLHELPRKYLGIKPGAADTPAVRDYRQNIRAFSKLDMHRTIRSLSAEEYERLLDAMKRHEGWREGREEPIEVKKVLGVHLNSLHVIWEFLVGDSKTTAWISKWDALALTRQGKLHAVIVQGKRGLYLRPPHGHHPFSILG
jgi:hypothetical protein